MSSQNTIELLRKYESRNITFLDPDGGWPIIWERARGVHVWDAEGRRYLDLTAAFGVAAVGHTNPRVVRAGQKQMSRLLHAMGDVHPHALKARLARELSRITFERWSSEKPKSQISNFKSSKSAHGKTIFCNSGFEAVEAALKTAALATGKSGIIAFKDAYHGLGYGTLNATHREHFRGPFLRQLGQFATFLSFPKTDQDVRTLNRDFEIVFAREKKEVGAILVEPIQVRGGINVPPPAFLPLLRMVCDRFGALLILDEIYTGFGRAGKWFACEHSNTVPDLICLGKAMTGGFPLSACVGRADVMDAAWPPSHGEAIHTSTYLGHPVGCAMALAQIDEIRREKLSESSRKLGAAAMELLNAELLSTGVDVKSASLPCSSGERTALSAPVRKRTTAYADNAVSAPSSNRPQVNIRGIGLLIGLELLLPNGRPATEIALAAIKQMLRQGYILLPEGEHANVISLTPPLIISEGQLRQTVRALAKTLKKLAR
jgi:4-aminobutyrate aminotransferase-like enzyme